MPLTFDRRKLAKNFALSELGAQTNEDDDDSVPKDKYKVVNFEKSADISNQVETNWFCDAKRNYRINFKGLIMRIRQQSLNLENFLEMIIFVKIFV